MKPKISIIVPIYNMERYLERCLNSLLSQTFTDFDVIAVDDGSTDRSLEILKNYAKKDNRISVVSKPNGGVSSARNKGISIANGQYIGFVDPDDWVDRDMYESMYSVASKENIDIVMCSYMREFGNHSKQKVYNVPEKVLYFGEEVKENITRRLVGPLQEEIANPELLDAWGTVWSKLYKSEIIKENNICFQDLKEIGSNEDTLFNIEATFYANSFIFLNKPFYHYWRANDTSVTTVYKPELLKQFKTLYTKMEAFLIEKNTDYIFHEALNNRICLNTLGIGLNTVSKGNKESFIAKNKNLHSILNDYKIKQSFNSFDLKYFSPLWKVFFYFAKIRFTLGFYFMVSAIDILRKVVR
ncbi:glycosyltransferase [Bacillus sp. 1P02SD]|uniref:glycosyltransferase n=1 Tax=Bacillus sp. 1P02SD TaxID=3132264 RepID=UPI00399F7B6A